jgi:hypothetical protein
LLDMHAACRAMTTVRQHFKHLQGTSERRALKEGCPA